VSLEASIIQWTWKEQVFPQADQFNSLHEKLIGKWKDLRTSLAGEPIYFANAMDSTGEDLVTVSYLRDTCERAGLTTLPIQIDDIGIDARGRFLDLDDREIRQVFKLYPWEWMVREEYGRNVVNGSTLWIEPLWKMLWSNKAILAVLWALDPGNPYLLPAQVDGPIGTSHVRKPLLSREGANITLVRDGVTVQTSGGDYGGSGYVYQELLPLPDFDGVYPVIGSWIVDGEPAGMGIREDGLITGNAARFVPHIIE
jgi:glutathionylspermidine synthase